MNRIFLCVALLCGTGSIRTMAQPHLLQEYHHLDSICDAVKNEQPSAVVENTRRMLEIARQLQRDSFVLNAAFLQGQALDFLGLFDAALKSNFEHLSLAEQTGNGYYKVKISGAIGRIYQIIGDKERCREYILKSKSYAVENGMFSDTIMLNYDIGFNQAESGDLEGGIQLIEKNLSAARIAHDTTSIVFGIDNLSNLYAHIGQYQKALDLELELLQHPEWWKEDLDKAQIYEHLAEIYVLLKDWNPAQHYQKLALHYSRLGRLNDWIYECYRLQSEIDEAQGHYRAALDHHRLYTSLKDSVYQSEYEGRMAALSALYELESRQKTISLLETDRQIQQNRLLQQRAWMLGGMLLLLLGFAGYRVYAQKQTQRLKEVFAQELIKTQENERRRIAKDLHDSVGQNILFVKNRLQRLFESPDAPLIHSIDLALDEIRNIAKDLYPNQLEVYGLSAAVDLLCQQASAASGIFISSDLQGIDDKLNRDAQINCYRIIQECINNALKHAEATAIRISSNVSNRAIELVVQDNGKGFEKEVLSRQMNRSFGWLNLEERTRMLRGELQLESTANRGARITFNFPI